jgi:hypothetical protein
MKLVGFIEMKKTTGKVLFVVEENAGGAVVGHSTDKLFFYGDNSKKINASAIGKTLECSWERGYGDRAKLIDVNIK